MLTFIFAELVHGFRRVWKLYLTNVLAISVIVLLLAYLDGSRRQLNLQNTVFSGEIVFTLNSNVNGIENTVREAFPEVVFQDAKVRTSANYKFSGKNNTGACEIVGVNFNSDPILKDYLTLAAGRMPSNSGDILVPSSLLQKGPVKLNSVVRIVGKTAQKIYNAGSWRVCGIYHSAGTTLFQQPRFLASYASVSEFYQPKEKNVEHCLFFRGAAAPNDINMRLRKALHDTDRTLIDSIENKRVSSFDVLNISVQFNVFLNLIVILTILVVLTMVMLVNFNVYLIMFRKRHKEIGTLMASGVNGRAIGATLWLEAFFQLVLSAAVATVICVLASVISRNQLAGGFLEILFVLLSGTNRIDFFVQPGQVWLAFVVVWISVTVAQIPLLAQLFFKNPMDVMSGR